jgi:magnesium-transporting ATPase (P-type)
MLWVNLIMDTFAALALATEPPSADILNRQPIDKDEYIVTAEMGVNVLGACIYQTIWLSVILFLFPMILDITPGWEHGKWTIENGVHFTIFFNAFVFLQLFNEINCRKLEANQLNVFKGFFNNGMFLAIIVVTIVV